MRKGVKRFTQVLVLASVAMVGQAMTTASRAFETCDEWYTWSERYMEGDCADEGGLAGSDAECTYMCELN